MGSHSVTCHPAEVTAAFTLAEAGTRFSNPEGMEGWVDLGTMGVTSLFKTDSCYVAVLGR